MALSDSASLLALPQEIRNIIYKELLYIPNTIPLSPSHIGLRIRNQNGRFNLSSERFPAYSHLNLLLCNHQLCAEFLEFLESPQRAWEYAKLDCMMRDDHSWVTWTIFPAGRFIRVRNLDIDLRIWDVVTEWRATLLWIDFSYLLLSLLDCGPTFRLGPRDAIIRSVDTISIRLLLQAPATEKKLYIHYDEDAEKELCIDYDEYAQLEKVGVEFKESLPNLAARMLNVYEFDIGCEVERLKLIYGDKVCEFVVGTGEFVVMNSGA